MIVLDTTVLVYAVGAEHAYRDPCRTLLEAVTAGEIEATTTAEVVQQFAHVRARRRDRKDVAEHALDVVRLLSPLLPVGEQDVRDGLAIWLRSASLGAFDSVLAATAIAHNVEALVSADRYFAGIRDLVHVLPSAKGVAGLLTPPA